MQSVNVCAAHFFGKYNCNLKSDWCKQLKRQSKERTVNLVKTKIGRDNVNYNLIHKYNCNQSTVNDRYSGDRFSGNDGFSGTKNPDDAILFTVSGITKNSRF